MNTQDIAISVEGISKCYRLGMKENVQDNFATTLVNFIKSPIKNYQVYRSLYKFDDVVSSPSADEEAVFKDSLDLIWALKNVSFKVNEGEVVGIIGRNGAGKSTLLKVLSKITTPIMGRAVVHGRISSLLEVGTGFHPELTGKENIYLNGTILGMRKHEVDSRFDQIVEFSGVERFLSTPVKRYSSGMRVRLAFSVAAHLEPEIMIIDEVLAVGDAEFQKKCLNKMQDVGQSGRTVLFVSHNMPAIIRLCPRAILLEDGSIAADGPSPQIVRQYLGAGMTSTCEYVWPELAGSPGNDIVRLRAVRIRNEAMQVKEELDIRYPIGLEMEYEVLKSGHILLPYYNIYNNDGIRILSAVDQSTDWKGCKRDVGLYKSIAWIPGNLMTEGTFYVGAAMRAPDIRVRHFNENDAVAFQVIDDMEGDSARGDFAGYMRAAVRPLLKWETQFRPAGNNIGLRMTATKPKQTRREAT